MSIINIQTINKVEKTIIFKWKKNGKQKSKVRFKPQPYPLKTQKSNK